MGSLLHHVDRPRLAFLRTDAAALAVVEPHDGPSRLVDPDCHVRTELPAHVALRARLEMDHGEERPPARGLDHVARHRRERPLGQVLLRDVRGRLVRVVTVRAQWITACSSWTSRSATFATSTLASIFAGMNFTIRAT